MSSVISRTTDRLRGRTALIVGLAVLAVSLAVWIPATGILHPFMVDLDTYQRAAQHAHHDQSGVYAKGKGFGLHSKGPFLYPPFALAILMQIDSLSFAALCWGLSIVSAAALLSAVHVLVRRLVPAWDRQTALGWTLGISGLALWLEPITRTFMFGQVSLILLALVVVDLTLPDDSRWKGVGIGFAIAIKLTPAVFVLYLLGTRRFRAAARSCIVFAGTAVLGFLVLPTASSQFWFHSLKGPDQINNAISVGDASDQSLRAVVVRMMHASSALNPVWYPLCALVLAAGLYAAVQFHKRGDDLGGLVIVAGAGLLVSPISWTHHWVWILPALLVLGHRLAAGVPAAKPRRLLTGAFVLATLIFLAYPMRLNPNGSWASAHDKNATWRPTSITWTQPHQFGLEFHWTAWNFLVGNLYVLAGVCFISVAAGLAWSRRKAVIVGPNNAGPVVVHEAPELFPAFIGTAFARLRANLRTRRVFEPLAVGLGSATLLFTRLMVPNQVGIADNYDGGRLLCHFNVIQAGTGSTVLQKFVQFTYVSKGSTSCGLTQYNGKDLPHPAYESSQLIVLQISKVLTKLLGLHGALDLRVVGFVCCLLIGGAVGLLFAVLRCRPLVRYLLCATLVLITADAAFIDFAVSPLSEISAVIGLLYVLPAVVLLTRGGRARRHGLVLGLTAGLFLTMSKAQMVILAIPIGVLLASFPLEFEKLRGPIGRRVVPMSAGLLLLLVSLGLTPKQDAHFAVINKGDFVFTSLLRTSPNPTADLASLGIPAEFADQIGKEIWCGTGPAGSTQGHHIGSTPYEAVDRTTGKLTTFYRSSGEIPDAALAKGMSRGTVVKFLLTHPDRAVNVMNSAADDFLHVRPQFSVFCPADPSHAAMNADLGNFSAASGKAPYAVDPIAPVTVLLGLFAGWGLIPLLVLWLAPLAVAGRLALRRARRSTGDGLALAWTTVVLSSVAVAQFLTSALGDGIDTTKHLNLSIYATALAIATAAAAWSLRGRGTEPASPTAETGSADTGSGETASGGTASEQTTAVVGAGPRDQTSVNSLHTEQQ